MILVCIGKLMKLVNKGVGERSKCRPTSMIGEQRGTLGAGCRGWKERRRLQGKLRDAGTENSGNVSENVAMMRSLSLYVDLGSGGDDRGELLL